MGPICEVWSLVPQDEGWHGVIYRLHLSQEPDPSFHRNVKFFNHLLKTVRQIDTDNQYLWLVMSKRR